MMNATKIIIGVLVVLALIGVWMYYSAPQTQTPADVPAATSGNGQSASLPPASDSLDDISAAVSADSANDLSLASEGNDADAVVSDSATVTSVSDASNGSY